MAKVEVRESDVMTLFFTAVLSLLIDGLCIMVLAHLLARAGYVPALGYWDSVAAAAALRLLRAPSIRSAKK